MGVVFVLFFNRVKLGLYSGVLIAGVGFLGVINKKRLA